MIPITFYSNSNLLLLKFMIQEVNLIKQQKYKTLFNKSQNFENLYEI